MAGVKTIMGNAGCLLMADTSAYTSKIFMALIVQEDTVIATLTSKSGTNLLTTYGLSGKTLKAGAFIPCMGDDYIASVTLTSGSLIGYNNI